MLVLTLLKESNGFDAFGILLRIFHKVSVSFLMICNTFSNPRVLIALEFNSNFGLWERFVINANKDIEKVFTCFIGVFSFENVIPISVLQSIFKFIKKKITVRAFAGRFCDCFFGLFH